MRKGKITITKKGGAKIKPDDGGGELTVPKVFDLKGAGHVPDQGKNRLECQFEGGSGTPLTKIIIEGKEIAKNQAIIEERENARREAEERTAEEEHQRQAALAKEKAQKTGTWWDDSFQADESCLPADTQALLQDSDNFHLKLNKVPRYIEDKFYFYKNDYNRKKDEGHRFRVKPQFGNFDFAGHCQKHLKIAQGLGLQVFHQPLSIDWRLILGLGHESVYETSMTLHHIYGIPYLPASSLKGVVRSWVIQQKFYPKLSEKEKTSKDAGKLVEKKALQDRLFCDIFGCGEESHYREARQGLVTFFDAFPMGEPQLEVDIMNPHYPDYYAESPEQARTLPTDYQSPIPIPFLTVSSQTAQQQPLQFLVMLGSADQSLLAEAQNWLLQALTQRGIGAKTAAGYGVLHP